MYYSFSDHYFECPQRNPDREKRHKDSGTKDIQDDEATNDSGKEDSINDEHDQDSIISFEIDTESTSSQEEELVNWIEYIKRSAREADDELLTNSTTNWKWRQALRDATQSQEKCTRRAAE